jgi:proline iminopeptidase
MKTHEGYVRASSGSRLYYRRAGRGPTTLVIPLAAWWGTQADVLADRMAIVLYDPPGRGRSDPIGEDAPAGLEGGVAALEAVRRELGLERVSLMGWSFLGALVVLYAAAHPDAVERIVQVGPLVPRRDPYWGEWMTHFAARAERIKALGLVASADTGAGSATEKSRMRSGLLATVLPQLGDLSVAEMIVDAVGTDTPNEHPDALAKLLPKMFATLGAWDFRPAARAVRAPVLTVRGSEDNIPLSGCREWVAVLPDARLLEIEGAGHYPFYERPDQFFAAAAGFLEGRWPDAAVGPSDRTSVRAAEEAT